MRRCRLSSTKNGMTPKRLVEAHWKQLKEEKEINDLMPDSQCWRRLTKNDMVQALSESMCNEHLMTVAHEECTELKLNQMQPTAISPFGYEMNDINVDQFRACWGDEELTDWYREIGWMSKIAQIYLAVALIDVNSAVGSNWVHPEDHRHDP